MAMAAGPAQLPARCKQRLAEFLRQVDDTDLVWLQEIREEAARMFSRYRSPPPPPTPVLLWAVLGRYRPLSPRLSPSPRSHCSDEPQLMPKTPSQKNRQRRKRLSALREEDQELCRKR